MNIVDYILIAILILSAIKGYKTGLIPSIVNVVGIILVFVIAFYIKNPIADMLFKNLPFLNFGGIFTGITVANILFYEAIAYGLSVIVLGVIFTFIKRLSFFVNHLFKITIFLNLPSKIIGAIVGIGEGILYSFILLYIASVVNRLTPYVMESKYGMKVLNDTPIVSSVANNLVSSVNEIYDIILKNENNASKANLESVDVLMKYDILNYDTAKTLVEKNKLSIEGINDIIEKYKGETQ